MIVDLQGAVETPSTPLSSTKSPGKKAKSPGKALISFQKKTIIPAPLFFKTKGMPGTPGTPRSKVSRTHKGKLDTSCVATHSFHTRILACPDVPCLKMV